MAATRKRAVMLFLTPSSYPLNAACLALLCISASVRRGLVVNDGDSL